MCRSANDTNVRTNSDVDIAVNAMRQNMGKRLARDFVSPAAAPIRRYLLAFREVLS